MPESSDNHSRTDWSQQFMAAMLAAGDGSGYLDVKVVVRSEGGRKTPLMGAEDFFLHPTFPFPKRRVPVRNGRAILIPRIHDWSRSSRWKNIAGTGPHIGSRRNTGVL